MRARFFLLSGLFGCCFSAFGQDLTTPYEASGKTATATYQACRDWYRKVQQTYPDITYFDSIGVSDGGFPIYVFRIYNSENAQPVKVLVMNNIHPGEPEGTDASMLMVKGLLENQRQWKKVLENVDLNIICQYNTDGTISRSCCTRANQNGPEELGFRGNAKNLDLNRDFIKCDSRNARFFTQYFTKNKFHIFIDNHTSNGADYQYTLTYFHTRPEKLDPVLVPFLSQISKGVNDGLVKRKIPSAPYVETKDVTPDNGIIAFWESGRFATGFAALHHCIGFTVETHMWKPFPDRVAVTQAFMEEVLENVSEKKITEGLYKAHRSLLSEGRLADNRNEMIQWELDRAKADTITFLGYNYYYKTSSVTDLPSLYYDRRQPWEKRIPYYRYYKPIDSLLMPRAYIIPVAWQEVAERLRWNGMHLKQLPKDTLMSVRTTYISSYETVAHPYESHYMHYNTQTRDTVMPVQFHAGDYLLVVNQTNRAFLAATLEPRSPDSYFNWNFFDGILQQKEWFSDYIFEEKAAQILAEDTALRAEFKRKKAADSAFAASNWAQLTWVYHHSVYYEKGHNRYPVFRME